MARFEIKSKDGNSIRYSGKPRYNGSYLKPSYLEFSEIASSTPIAWEVGDYVDYPRTGMRYRLYSVPQPSKNARKGVAGNSFTYPNVQLYSATKELEIALFRDLVDNDNNIHFSTSPDVATFENVEGIIRRIQVCMNDLYPGRWEIRLASFDAEADAEVIERIAEPKDFALSGGTCLDALSKIYDLWDGIGWFHSHENGKEVITVGYANTKNAGNTTEPYLYGRGNGLTAIKKYQTNKEELATRLYVYGSERNLPVRYYNEKDILNAESVDIRNLMLPLDFWGKTDGLPDARKAYLENAEAVAKFGVIPKVHYFDSVDAGADIYPTIEGMTIGGLRKALEAMGDTRYYPSATLYPDASMRVDEVRYVENPTDTGEANPQNLEQEEVPFTALWGRTRKISTGSVSDTMRIASFEFNIDEPTSCEVVVTPNISGYINDGGFDSVLVSLCFKTFQGVNISFAKVTVAANKVNDKWEFVLPKIREDYHGSPRTGFPVYLDFEIEAFGNSPEHARYILNEGTITYTLKPFQNKTFFIQLNEIGFNINEMAERGKGKIISMKTGSCAGRNFVIETVSNRQGYWNLTCKRQQDNTLGLLFPNSAYQIAKGDRFVLLDIAMPDAYIYAATDRLLSEGEKFLEKASKIQNHYEPAIDAKVMIESGRTLREGMFMLIEDEDVVDNTADHIIIDTLSIYEDESAIPTYKVTLREKRKVTYKGTPSATSATDRQSVEEDTKQTTTPSFESFWEEDEDGNIFTTRQIRIKNNLIVDGDTASGGAGNPGTVVGATSVVVAGNIYPAKNGVIDMTEAFAGLSIDVDLSDYYTKTEVNELIDGVTSGDIDLANYYTKSQVDDKFEAIDFSPYAEKTYVEGVEVRVSTLEKAGYATKVYVDTSISNLVNGAPSTLDTLKEIADAFEDSQDVIDALDKAIGTKASQTALDSAVERVGVLESTLKTEQGHIDVLQGYFSNGIAKKATADAKGNVIDTYYTPIATHNAFKESINASLVLKASASDLSALSTRVGANEKSITSLQSVKADKATTLAGYGIKDAYTTTQIDAKVQTINDALALRYTKNEVDGIVTTINQSIKSVDEKYAPTKTWADTLASLIVNENGNIRIKTNLIVNGDTASGGGSGESAIGITGIILNGTTYRDENSDGIIDLGTITSGLTSVNWTDVLDRPTSLSQFNNDLGLGTLAYKNGLTASDVGALSTSGGTITSASSPLIINRTSNNPVISYQANGTLVGVLGFDTSENLIVSPNRTTNSNYYNVLHSGNIGSYKAGDSDKLGGLSASSYVATKTITGDLNAADLYGSRSWILSLNSSAQNVPSGMDSGEGIYIAGYDTGFMLLSSYTQDKLMYRRGSNSLGSNKILSNAWKEIAFTDSNVASATKLATARTIWGRSFDGTGDVNGNLFLNNGSYVRAYLADGTSSANILGVNAKNALLIGYGLQTTGVVSIYGKEIHFAPSGEIAKMLINSSGNVTIGASDLASTDYKLYVSGNTCIGYNGIYGEGNESMLRGSANAISIGYGYRNLTTDIYGGTIRFYRGEGTTSMLINSSGNVGIGTTDPQYKLDVNGTLGVYNGITLYGGDQINGTTGIAINYGSGSQVTTSIWDGAGARIALFNTDRSSNFYGAVAMASTLNVSGASTFKGNTSISGVLTLFSSLVTSGTIFLGNGNEGLYINRHEIAWHTNANAHKAPLMSFSDTAITILKEVSINGATYANAGLSVTGALSVGGASTFNGDVRINGNLVVTGDTASGGTAGTTNTGVLVIQEPPTGTNITQAQLDAIGLTETELENIVNGVYHHVKVQWGPIEHLCNVSMAYSSTHVMLCLKFGDSHIDNWEEWVFYRYNNEPWTVEFYEV